MENVRTGPDIASAMSATTMEESIPPLRNAPTGTSLISRMRTHSRSRVKSSSASSSSFRLTGRPAEVPITFYTYRSVFPLKKLPAGSYKCQRTVSGSGT